MANNRNKKRKVNATGRNEHSKFVKLDHYMLRSPAYRLLSPTARALLVEFIYRFNGMNNGLLWMSQRDAAKVLGLKTHTTAGKYIKELVDRGFLRVVVQGSFDNKQCLASVFELTMVKNVDQDGPASKDFMNLSLSAEEKKRAENMRPSWATNRPVGWKNLPEGFADAAKDQTRSAQNISGRGANDHTTYNIPGNVERDLSEGDRSEAA